MVAMMPPMSDMTPENTSDETIVGRHPPERMALIERLRLVCLGQVFALIILGVAWELWLAPLPGGTGALALKVVPLFFTIGGMWRHRMYTYRWTTLLVWLYVAEGLVRASGDPGLSAWLAGLEVVLSVGLFVACSAYVRLRLRVLPSKQAANAGTNP